MFSGVKIHGPFRIFSFLVQIAASAPDTELSFIWEL